MAHKSIFTLLATTALIITPAAHAQEHDHDHAHDHKAHGHHSHGLRDRLAGEVKDGVSVGGFIRSQANIIDQDLNEGDPRDFTLMNDTEIHLRYQGRADNGLIYGAVVELEADVTEAFKEEGENADKTYIYLKSSAGKLELGNNSDAGHHLSVNPSKLAKATGGIHGDTEELVLFPEEEEEGGGEEEGHHHARDFITQPSLPVASVHEIREDATKITYYSPRFEGFQFGASFIPDTGNGGTAAGFTSDGDEDDYENVINLGAQYQGQVNDVDVGVSIIGEFGEAEDAAQEDLSAYEVAVELGYHGVTVSGSYGDLGDSGYAVSDTYDDAHYWAAGAAYDTNSAGFSVTYLDGEFKENTTQLVSLGAEYYLAPGLTPYVEANFVELDHHDADVEDNDATLFLAGVAVQF